MDLATLNLPLALAGFACFFGGISLKQFFLCMIGCDIILIGLSFGYYVTGIAAGVAIQIVGAAVEMGFGRSASWTNTVLGNLGAFVVAGSTVGANFSWSHFLTV